MQTLIQQTKMGSWIKLLSKGLLTIPKPMREQLNLQEGEVVKIRVIGKRLVIEPRELADYKMISDEELNEMIEMDTLPPKLAKATEKYWSDFNL